MLDKPYNLSEIANEINGLIKKVEQLEKEIKELKEKINSDKE